MEKKPRKKKRDYDFSVRAFEVVQQATAEAPKPAQAEEQPTEGKNPHAVALGRLGGKKGGPARAKRLTANQRKEIAQRAARARWRRAGQAPSL